MARGYPSHLDLSVGDVRKSIPFYHALLTELGYARHRPQAAEWRDPSPSRAAWSIEFPDGSRFGIDLRPASADKRHRRYDRYAPGPHHLAFHVDDDDTVDRVYEAMLRPREPASHAQVLDAPAHYGGRPGYGEHYYAVFFADPDGFKVEVVHAPDFAG